MRRGRLMELSGTVEQEQLSGLAGHDLAQLAESSRTQSEEWDEFIAANDLVLVAESRNCWMIRVSGLPRCLSRWSSAVYRLEPK